MIELVIFDWAGTTIDYGCIAPVDAFAKAFKKNKIEVTIDEVRKPMGMLKWDHIEAMLKMPRINEEFKRIYGREFDEHDVNTINNDFEDELFKVLKDYTTPLPHVLEVVTKLRENGIKIGSTTGYNSKMMKVVTKEAREEGYAPDYYSTADKVGKGRPSPLMIEDNMKHFEISDPKKVIKVGDTTTDILEGKNAKVISVATILGSSELGLKEDEIVTNIQVERVKQRFQESKADYILNDISELPELIDKLNKK